MLSILHPEYCLCTCHAGAECASSKVSATTAEFDGKSDPDTIKETHHRSRPDWPSLATHCNTCHTMPFTSRRSFPAKNCQIGRFCTGLYLENCARSLSADYTSPPDQEDADTPDGESSASPSTSPVSNSSVELTINTTALSALELEPVGGVTAAGGDLVVDNVRRWLSGLLIKDSRQRVLFGSCNRIGVGGEVCCIC